MQILNLPGLATGTIEDTHSVGSVTGLTTPIFSSFPAISENWSRSIRIFMSSEIGCLPGCHHIEVMSSQLSTVQEEFQQRFARELKQNWIEWKQKEPLHPHPIPSRPFQRIGADLFEYSHLPKLAVCLAVITSKLIRMSSQLSTVQEEFTSCTR